jgi:hypothetical protein
MATSGLLCILLHWLAILSIQADAITVPTSSFFCILFGRYSEVGVCDLGNM